MVPVHFVSTSPVRLTKKNCASHAFPCVCFKWILFTYISKPELHYLNSIPPRLNTIQAVGGIQFLLKGTSPATHFREGSSASL